MTQTIEQIAAGKPVVQEFPLKGGSVRRRRSLHTHPADGKVAHVDCGDGAQMTIKDPTAETGLVWILTWGNAESVKYTVGSILQSFDYLISDSIGQGEADRRLRLLRSAWKELVLHGPLPELERQP